jgi:hypothetical protein
MKKLLLLLLLFPLFTLAQDTTKIPTPVAKTIIKELVSCDSLKEIHSVTVEELSLMREAVAVQNKMIEAYKEKGAMYEQRIKNEEQKFSIQGEWIEDLRRQNKRLKIKLRFIQVAGAAVGGILTYLYITK